MMTDPLGDMLTRIRNGQQAKKDSVLSPASKLRASVLATHRMTRASTRRCGSN
jgi:ribosomal protein S8